LRIIFCPIFVLVFFLLFPCIFIKFYLVRLDGFPYDFSILAAFKSSSQSAGELLTVYSADGSLVLSLKVAKRVVLLYQGGQASKKARLRFQLKIKDDE
jgi:hypothetical protein